MAHSNQDRKSSPKHIKVYREDDSYIPVAIIDIFKEGISALNLIAQASVRTHFKTIAQINKET